MTERPSRWGQPGDESCRWISKDYGRLSRVARAISESSDVQFPDIGGTRAMPCRREGRSAPAQQEASGRHGGQCQQSDTKAANTHLPVETCVVLSDPTQADHS